MKELLEIKSGKMYNGLGTNGKLPLRRGKRRIREEF
jgi:hypothetical protein